MSKTQGNELSKENRTLLRLACKTLIPMLAYRYMPDGGRDELESYLLEKLGCHTWPKMYKNAPYVQKKSYILRSLKGYCLNYYRDEQRLIKLSRAHHDKARLIYGYVRDHPHLEGDVQAICFALNMTKHEYNNALLAYNTRVQSFEPYMAAQLEDASSSAMIQCLSMADKCQCDRFVAGEISQDQLIAELSPEGLESINLALGYKLDYEVT